MIMKIFESLWYLIVVLVIVFIFGYLDRYDKMMNKTNNTNKIFYDKYIIYSDYNLNKY